MTRLEGLPDGVDEAYPEVSSYIGEVDAYLSSAALEAGIHDAPSMGRRLRSLAMGAWMAIVFEALTGPAADARTMAVDLLAAEFGTTAADVERRVAAA